MKHRKGQPKPQALVSREEIPLARSATSPWDHPDVVDFYSSARRGFDDFYPSEQRLAPYVARRVRGGGVYSTSGAPREALVTHGLK